MIVNIVINNCNIKWSNIVNIAWYPTGVFLSISLSQSLHQRALTNGPEKEKEGVIQNFKRTLSKKEKKKEKKREKEAFSRIPDGDDHTLNREDGWGLRLDLYERMRDGHIKAIVD